MSSLSDGFWGRFGHESTRNHRSLAGALVGFHHPLRGPYAGQGSVQGVAAAGTFATRLCTLTAAQFSSRCADVTLSVIGGGYGGFHHECAGEEKPLDLNLLVRFG